MKRPIAPSKISERIKLIHGDQITLDETSYVNVRTRAKFIDKDFGEWWTDPWGILTGRRHPKRGRKSMGQKQTITREEAVKRLQKVHGDLITLGDDYQGLSFKCTFIDRDFGTWVTYPSRLFDGAVHPKRRAEKAAATCMKRYGVGHTNHLPDVMRKIQSRSKWVKRFHWRTNEELTCMSSYEVAFVEWCAQNKIDFEWQIKHVMPDNKAYFIDARIIDGEFANMWIEIKGWMRPEGQRKWDWFRSLHPNSQLWTRAELKRLEILR